MSQFSVYTKPSDATLISQLEQVAQKNRRSFSQQVLACIQQSLANGISPNGHSLNGHAPKPKIGRPLGSKSRKFRER